MEAKTRRGILVVLALCIAFSLSAQQTDILYTNYTQALRSFGTFSMFVVVSVKDLNTGLTREYCTKSGFLIGALDQECSLDPNCQRSELSALAYENRERYFELRSESALQNIIGFEPYSMKDLEKLERKVNFDALAKKIQKRGEWSMELFDGRLMRMYAHALFNRGILTGENGCYGGTLEYVPAKGHGPLN